LRAALPLRLAPGSLHFFDVDSGQRLDG